jgi:RHS repeat-associated protein
LSNGTCTEDYDKNGNLLHRTDAASVMTTFTYDALNRPTGKSYSDHTPPVTMTYDETGSCPSSAQAYNVGQLTSVTTTAYSANVPTTSASMSYDALGRICSSSEQVGSAAAYPFSYQYNLAGGLTGLTYPSQRVVSTTYDALNRPNGVTAGTATYANSTNTNYASNGALAQIEFGPATAAIGRQTITFDPIRQQPSGIAVTAKGATVLSLGYSYCPGSVCTGNNGNVVGQTIAINGGSQISQVFQYDALNRLSLAVEQPASSWLPGTAACPDGSHAAWCQQYTPGRYGNTLTSSVNLGSFSAPAGFDDATNRISPNNQASGWAYNTVGQLTRDSGNTSYGYDAEGRMVASCPNLTGWTTCTNTSTAAQSVYVYDGLGRRVEKQNPNGTTVYVYDGAGELAAEYGGSTGAAGTQYLVADTLGSTRLILSSSGCVTSRQDYLPFGYAIPSSAGSRSVQDCGVSTYTVDGGVTEKFTGKERDAETGLDYFGARYFSAAQGRFTGPDWSDKPEAVPYADLADPQSFNLYAYVRNNPLNKRDLDGHGCPPICSAGTADAVINHRGNPIADLKALVNDPYVQGGTKVAIGLGLIMTVAFGDVPGGALGAVMVANAAIGGTATTVSGTTQIIGAATKTDTEEAQTALAAVGTIPGTVTAAVTGGNLKAGETVSTLTNAVSLAAAPKEAVKNVATAADAAQTARETSGVLGGFINSVKNFFSPPPVPKPATPTAPACSVQGACGK